MNAHLDRKAIAEQLTAALMLMHGRWVGALTGLGLGFEAEDAVAEAHLTMHKKLRETPLDEPALAAFLAQWSKREFVWSIVHHEALRLRRKRVGTTRTPEGARRYRPWISTDTFTSDLKAEPDEANVLASGPKTPDAVPDYLDRISSHLHLRQALIVLIDRSEHHHRGTFISPDQYASFHAATLAVVAGRKAPLADAAESLGIQATTVRQHVRRLQLAVLTTRYVVGVLGGPRWLRSPERITTVLDRFDSSLARTSRDRLLTASTCVTTNLDTGTRVDADQYLAATHSENLTDLHDEETGFGVLIAAEQTNCVTRCRAHNPTPDRVTEF